MDYFVNTRKQFKEHRWYLKLNSIHYVTNSQRRRAERRMASTGQRGMGISTGTGRRRPMAGSQGPRPKPIRRDRTSQTTTKRVQGSEIDMGTVSVNP